MLEGKYNFKDVEKKWQDIWQNNKTFKFDKNSTRKTYAIDTPPPTVSGKIHMGHLSSYTHIETVARHKRMQNYNVFFPFGFDDNGMPTERYVEKQIGKKAYELDRGEFIDKCLEITTEVEKEFHSLYKSGGFSCDLENNYSSISKRTQAISQKSFLDLYKKGYIYQAVAPALWCTECRTSVAQSELENKDVDSTFNYIKFFIAGTNEYVTVATTRPEMLPACVCVFINPDDKKNAHLLNKKLVVPYFNFEVEVLADELVDLEKGSGVVMCCTFGDNVDKEWQRKHKLPIKEAFDNGGRMTALAGEFEGLKIKKARQEIIEKLKENDLLIKQEELSHAVSTHERCGTEIEIAVKKQWFINTMDHKEELLQAGREIKWHPENMRARYINWVENLAWDWCISRQKYFGVAFPVWYCKKCGKPVFADEKDLPVNPLVDSPKHACECGCNEFEPESDVMDTWATSSLTPQICLDLEYGEGLSSNNLPMDLRPNAHDNIRVWDFYTIVKSLYHFGKLPWKNIMISGYITTPDGSKMSKKNSNNKNSPQDILATYSADVTRYWASSLSLGKDTAFSLDNFDAGKKLANKLYNASKFALSFLDGYTKEQVELLEMDKWVIEKFAKMQKSFEKNLDAYNISLALNEIERFFWQFCDDYIELVKRRLYNPDVYGEHAKKSAQYAVYVVLEGILKLFSPFMPHLTEEIYMSYYGDESKKQSIHTSLYPEQKQEIDDKLVANGDVVMQVVSQIRQFKSENKVSLKTFIKDLEITCEDTDFMENCLIDIKAVGSIYDIEVKKGKFEMKFGEICLDEQN